MIADIALETPAAIEDIELETGGYLFRDENLLGTRAQFQLTARNFSIAQAAARAAREEVDRLTLILNSRDPESELSAMNRSLVHAASPELFEVVALAEKWRVESSNAFSGRLGSVIDAWDAAVSPPSRESLALLARQANEAEVRLDPMARTITRPKEIRFALDSIAKGWIVDRAFEVAIRQSGVFGALVDIGGDIRCGGRAPNPRGWCVGISDPHLPFDNAPLAAMVNLHNQAIATSGRGPRDRIFGGNRYSTTLSPRDGWPIAHHASVTAIASSAAEADALATSLLVSAPEDAAKFAEERGAIARITASDRSVAWTRVAQARSRQMRLVENEDVAAADARMWEPGWQALVTFTAPRRQLIRDPDFRSPYMALWITDLDNKPVRTLILIGKDLDWQQDNYIWWAINRDKIEKLAATRSMSTSGAGVYNVFWDGVDDRGQPVPAGKYLLHVETSRERGKHTYRSLTLNFEEFKRFVEALPSTEEGGGLKVSFDHY